MIIDLLEYTIIVLPKGNISVKEYLPDKEVILTPTRNYFVSMDTHTIYVLHPNSKKKGD